MASADVSIRLKHSLDEDGEYNAFTNVQVDILKINAKIGSIEATMIDRQRIPDGYFLSACDGHSGDLQHMGCTVYESRYGRTKLESLADCDDPEFDIVYIHSFHVHDEHKANSDVATTALHQFLHHPFIKGNSNFGCWKVSSAVYYLDPLEAMSKQERTAHEEKQSADAQTQYARLLNPPAETDETRRAKVLEKKKMEILARSDAIPFLRNGFFQDVAIARQGNERFVVASHSHWTRPLLSEPQAAEIQFYVSPPKPPTPMGKDAEILQAVISASGEFHSSQALPVSQLMISGPGMVNEALSMSRANTISRLRNDISNLVSDGGSIAQSHAIHAACANNAKPVLDLLLQLDRTIVNSLDQHSLTPLMIAAESAAGRSTNQGIPETQVIDTLLAAGADKQKQDLFGMTAYGHFKSKTAGYAEMMNAMMGKSSMTNNRVPVHSSHLIVEQKLIPPSGPTCSDVSGGQGEDAGFMDYSRLDREYDEEMCDYDSDNNSGNADY